MKIMILLIMYCFLETDINNVVGFYLNGINPMISGNHIFNSDDFNLFSLYDNLTEIKQGFHVKK